MSVLILRGESFSSLFARHYTILCAHKSKRRACVRLKRLRMRDGDLTVICDRTEKKSSRNFNLGVPLESPSNKVQCVPKLKHYNFQYLELYTETFFLTSFWKNSVRKGMCLNMYLAETVHQMTWYRRLLLRKKTRNDSMLESSFLTACLRKGLHWTGSRYVQICLLAPARGACLVKIDELISLALLGICFSGLLRRYLSHSKEYVQLIVTSVTRGL